MAAPVAEEPLANLEKKVLESVMAKLPKETMEVDGDGVFDRRFQDLEQRVLGLQDGQQQLANRIQEQGTTQRNQIQQLYAQSTRLEASVQDQSVAMGHFQTQFRAQLEQQQGQLDSLFRQQMDRIEELMKKQRREWWCQITCLPQERDGFKEWGKPHLGSLLILGILSILGIFWGVPPKASCLCQPGLVGALLVCCVRSCFACFQLLASGGTKGVSHRLHMQVDYPRRRLVKNRGPSFLMGVWLLLVMSFRIGEASNPGPGSNTEWTFGLCNPSGLTSKTDHVASMNGSVWVCCETHLTQSGVAQLKQGLKTLGSSFQYLVPGFPCEQRTSEDVGRFSGVLLLSQYPARPIAQQFPDELFRTARIQVAGLCVAQTWIQVGMLYGVPKSVSHHQAKYQTECLLETLIDRLVYQTKGPRILCGDLNFQPHELQQLSRLRAAGFREVQDNCLFSMASASSTNWERRSKNWPDMDFSWIARVNGGFKGWRRVVGRSFDSSMYFWLRSSWF